MQTVIAVDESKLYEMEKKKLQNKNKKQIFLTTKQISMIDK